MRVEKGKTLIAKGCVRIEGDAEVIGSRLKYFECDKFVPIECFGDVEAEVRGEYFIVDGFTIPESWKKLAKKDWETIFLYGGVDSGKSTLATYLANKVGGAYVLDLDIGQADIAHSGAMGYGFVKDVAALSQVEMINGFFVGSITPQGRELKCLRGVARLWKELKKLEGKKIIDTTGWIRGKRAKEYKMAKIEITEPDLIVSFEGKQFEDYEVYEVEKGPVLKRGKIERIKARCESYIKFLRNSKIMEFEKKNIKLKPDLLNGKDITQFIASLIEDVAFAKLGDGFLSICLKKRAEIDLGIIRELKDLYEVDDVFIFSEEELRNVIVGLYKGKKYLGMGLLKSINEKILIVSAFSDFDTVEIGEIRFEDGKEFFIRRY
ncbi:MAG: Clp1/GlmU family protein [Archaeoglobaceae archaeon]